MALPAWLRQRLGKPTRGRGAVAAKCIVCKASILIGMSEDAAAFRALVDPVALSPLGEALARIDGRKTYVLGKYDEGLALWERTHWQIESQKASPEVWVLADHKCGGLKFPAVEIPALSAPMKQPVSDDNEPPF